MPLIKISLTNPETNTVYIQQQASKIVAEVTGKPLSVIMVITDKASFMLNAEKICGAFIEIRGIGKIEPTTNAEISRRICQMLHEQLEIATENIYLNFFDISATNWGHAKGTY